MSCAWGEDWTRFCIIKTRQCDDIREDGEPASHLPNMNAIIRGGLAILFLCACARTAVATEATVRVAASRELRLAVVDSGKPSIARDALHAAFGKSLGDAVSKECGSAIGVRVKCVSADNAAFSLGNGAFDAVLILNGSLPRALMISDVTRLNATLGTGKDEKKVFLIFNNGDATLAHLFSASFAIALTDNKFLDSVDTVDAKLAVNGGSKLAAAR